jgi:oligoendopeptidase F
MPTPLQTQRTFSELLPTSDPTYRNQQRTFIETLFRDFTTKRKNNTDYLNDPATLKEALDDYETLQGGYGPGGKDFGIIGAESYYFRLQKTLHSDDETFLSGANKADEFATKMQNELLFFEHTLSTISPEKQAAFLASPLLSDYHHFLEKRFAEAHHLLTPEGEKILNILSKTSYENRAALTEKLLSQRVVSAP